MATGACKITGKVSAVGDVLPQNIKKPVINKAQGMTRNLLLLSSDTLSPEMLHTLNIVSPKFMAAGGISQVVIFAKKILLCECGLTHKNLPYIT